MKREDVKNKIPGITDEQLNWIMQENGADINREKSAATALQTQLDNANAQLKTAQDGLKAFDGVDVAGLQEQVTKLKADMKAQAEGFAFDNALNAAIMSKKGRSVKAVRALLDLDTLKGSADRSTDIAKALDDAAKASPWAFGDVQDGEKKNAGTYKIVYGTGSDIIVPYIYFSLRTGKGEKGSAAIIVTSDVGGAAGSKATFACDVKAIGTPDEFDYNPATQSAAPAKAVKG